MDTNAKFAIGQHVMLVLDGKDPIPAIVRAFHANGIYTVHLEIGAEWIPETFCYENELRPIQ